jgi:hypothetical protein
MNEVQNPAPSPARRFTGNDLVYYFSLALLFGGLAWHYSPAIAMIVLGALGVTISLVNAYLVIGLAARRTPKGK